MDYSPEHWMSDIYEAIKDKPINGICWPASHDSGMSMVNKNLHSLVANDCNTKTQSKTISEQLGSGVRVFDLRPFMWLSREGKSKYLAHFNYDPAVGACGESLSSALDSVVEFLKRKGNEKEVVFLQFSHCYKLGYKEMPITNIKFDNTVLSPFSDDDIEDLKIDISSVLGGDIYVSDNSDVNVGALKLDDVVNSGRRVFVTIQDEGFRSDVASGFLSIQTPKYHYIRKMNSCVSYSDSINVKSFYQYADTSSLEVMEEAERKMLEKYSACYESGDGVFSGLSWTLTRTDWAFGECIHVLAEKANNDFSGKINDYLKDGVITKKTKPSVVWFDYYSEACLEPLIMLNRL